MARLASVLLALVAGLLALAAASAPLGSAAKRAAELLAQMNQTEKLSVRPLPCPAPPTDPI